LGQPVEWYDYSLIDVVQIPAIVYRCCVGFDIEALIQSDACHNTSILMSKMGLGPWFLTWYGVGGSQDGFGESYWVKISFTVNCMNLIVVVAIIISRYSAGLRAG
jgi:hypothetical protein